MQWGQPTPVKGQRSPAFSRRRARRGGESGFGRFGNQTSHGGWLWVAGNMPQLLVESLGVGAAAGGGRPIRDQALGFTAAEPVFIGGATVGRLAIAGFTAPLETM